MICPPDGGINYLAQLQPFAGQRRSLGSRSPHVNEIYIEFCSTRTIRAGSSHDRKRDHAA